MKLAWFTPYSTTSSIGRCSYLIASELAKMADVDLWYPATESPRPSPVPATPFDGAGRIDYQRLQSYDLVFYCFGNYLPFHRDIFEVSRRVPGIAVIHDFVMHHFFAGYYFEFLKSPPSYLAAIERLYGGDARARAAKAIAGELPHLWETSEVARYPFFEPLLSGSLGTVVHGRFLLERAAPIAGAPLRQIHLPHDVAGLGLTLDRRALGIPEDRFLMVTIGHVNSNKRVLEVIDVLGRNPHLARGLVYAVVGPADPGYLSCLTEAVRRYHLDDAVRFTGYASDEAIHAYMRLADLCMNLRYPVIEGASGSAVEQMLHGKPIVVTRIGFYDEIPDECVWKIGPQEEAAELPAALERLRAEGPLRRSLGAAARAYAAERHNAARYARDLVSFAHEVMQFKPVLQLADRVAVELRRMGACAETPLAAAAAAEIHGLFGAARKS